MLPGVIPIWNRIAGDLPSRLRVALLAFAGILVATNVPFIILSSAPLWSRVTLGLLYLSVLVRWTWWSRGGQPVVADLILELTALVATTIVTIDPSNTASFLYAGVIIRAYYSSTRQLGWTLALYNVLFLASVLLAPQTDHSLMAPNVVSQPPTAAVAASVIAWFSRTVQQHHRLLAEHRVHVALQQELLTEVRAGHRRLRSLVEALPGAILTSTPAGEVRYVSPQAEQLFGIPAAKLQTRWTDLITDIIVPDDQTRVLAVAAAAITSGAAFSSEFRACKPTGEVIWLQVDGVLVDDGSPDSPLWQSLVFDVTERHYLTEQLTHQAFHDALTGLPNRQRFAERLDDALERATRTGSVPTVCFIDLDDFKAVNDTLGHLIGDRLIIEAASRLRRSVRDDDVVARLGGDEFALFLETPKGYTDIIQIVERFVSSLAQPFLLDGHVIATGASIGVAVLDRPGLSQTELIRRADVAMYAAKVDGKGRYAIYDESMTVKTDQPGDRERELGQVPTHDEFRIVYPLVVSQPMRVSNAVETLTQHGVG